jgi:hypothetical protein
MKRNTSSSCILLMVFFSGIVLPACKKSDPSLKDSTSSVKGKTWWGAITFTGKELEYYSVHFNADNTLLWSQASGDFSGQWIINGKELSMTFDVSKEVIKASISNDKLLNITDNTSSYEVNSGQLIENPDIPVENTIWRGQVLDGTPYTVRLEFKPNFKVDAQVGVSFSSSNTYTRSGPGSVIRITMKPASSGPNSYVFALIISSTEMRGSYNSKSTWQAIKY